MVQNTMRPRQRRRGSSAAQFVRLSALALIVSWTGLLFFVWATPSRRASAEPVPLASEFPLRDAARRAREAARIAAAASAEQRQSAPSAKHDQYATSRSSLGSDEGEDASALEDVSPSRTSVVNSTSTDMPAARRPAEGG